MHSKDVHKFSAGEMTVLSENAILIKFHRDERVSVKGITDARDKRRELIGEIPYFPIVDCREGLASFTSEAKSWVAVNKESSEMRLVDIIIVKSWGMKLEAKLYIKFFKPTNKTIIVKSLEEALEVAKKYQEHLSQSLVAS